MCGILGYLSYSETISNQQFEQALDFIYHRGPDDWGVEFHKHNELNYYQGFRRLSILDLSSAGHQPMSFENLCITFNGEVYNFQEVREDLIKLGYSFHSNTDTEVILKSIHQWGIDKAVSRFNGMFAIAIFNKQNNELTLVRDRLGIKPIYYYHENQTFIYSSEIKPIIQFDDIDKSIDSSSLHKYLSVGYVPADATLFKHINVVLPGEILVFHDNQLKRRKYWSVDEKFNAREISTDSEESQKQELKNLIASSVKYRMISDVPLGTFLSGGVDSSLVSAVMQSLSDKPINTFSIGFKEKEYNEANFAKEIANHLGTNHFELYLSLDEAKEMIPDLFKKLDQPFGDSSAIPMLMVSALAKQNVTVALSGDGGDELFCGYRLYDQALELQKYKSIAKFVKPIRKPLFNAGFLKSNYKYLNPLFADSDKNIVNSGNMSSQMFVRDLLLNTGQKVKPLFETLHYKTKNIQELNMLINIDSYLHDDILKKVDFATMAASLESRVPLLDHRIVEYSFNIPHRMKYKDGVKKHILKEVLYDYIPKEMMDRPKKGFSVPVIEWLHNDLYYLVEDSIDEKVIREQQLFDYSAVKDLVERFNNQPNNYFTNSIMWNFVVFQQWYKQNIL
jgi:asparagine synthase (glutamine-hydrolysing)